MTYYIPPAWTNESVAAHVVQALAAERERCAKVCEAVAREYAYLGSNVAEACVVAIRKGE